MAAEIEGEREGEGEGEREKERAREKGESTQTHSPYREGQLWPLALANPIRLPHKARPPQHTVEPRDSVCVVLALYFSREITARW